MFFHIKEKIMMKKYFVFLVFMLSACVSDAYITHTDEYLCGNQLVSVEYISDGGIVVDVNGNQMYLNRCLGGCGNSYQDITGNTQFWRKGKDGYLKIGTLTYPVCKNLF